MAARADSAAGRAALHGRRAVVWARDCANDLAAWLRGEPGDRDHADCPTVCAIIAGYNETDGLEATLRSFWGSSPRLQIVVVDDGSTDAMAEVAAGFARGHAGVTVVRKPQRGGKASALNAALAFTDAEILVCVDGDSRLGSAAIWEIVQPFSDPGVGAVSGVVFGRRPFANLITWLQSFEYLRCIFVGRISRWDSGNRLRRLRSVLDSQAEDGTPRRMMAAKMELTDRPRRPCQVHRTTRSPVATFAFGRSPQCRGRVSRTRSSFRFDSRSGSPSIRGAIFPA